MTQPAAFRATYSDLKLIKTRQCVQIIFELPLADFDAAYEVLGGMPNPAAERWFAVAAINLPQAEKEIESTPSPATQPQPDTPRPAGAKQPRDWKELLPAQQAGIRCGEPTFRAFLKEVYKVAVAFPNEAAVAVRDICEVNSRTELNTNHVKRVLWFQLDSEFEAWKLSERVGA